MPEVSEHDNQDEAHNAGARNSITDLRRIQLVHALSLEIKSRLEECQDQILQVMTLAMDLGAAPVSSEMEAAYMAANKGGEGIPSGFAIGKFVSVKALGDWILDVTGAPFKGSDSDGQTFDDGTDFMLEIFSTPAILYHHGIMPGKQSLQGKPVVIGKTLSVEKKADGIHLRVLLDKTLEYARRVWEAAQKGIAVASSDSIAHLARLEVGGRLIMYEKGKAGRIAVWPLAGVSLWDKVPGNFSPASRYALALPAVKAIYQEAGIPFPEINLTSGGSPEAVDTAASRARQEQIEQIKQQARTLLAHLKE